MAVPIVADQATTFGALTKASAGAFTPVNSGGAITNASIDSGNTGTHFQISAAGLITPTAAGDTANLASGPYVLGCTFTNADGSDTATITITADANTYSVLTGEISAAFTEIGTASAGARTIKIRPGDFTISATTSKNHAFTNIVTITSHDTSNMASVPAGWDVRNCDNMTFDYIRCKFFLIRDTSTNIVFTNCNVGGYTVVDPTDDATWSLGAGSLTHGFLRDGTTAPGIVTITDCNIHDCNCGINLVTSGVLTVERNTIDRCYEDGLKVGTSAATIVRDNVISHLFGKGSDVGSPHCDFMQFLGAGVTTTGIIIERNIMFIGNARGVPQGIFLDNYSAGHYADGIIIAGNITVEPTTRAINIGQAKDVVVYGNTCRGMVIGTGSAGYTSTGTHTITDNAYTSLGTTGSHTQVNNATVLYSTTYFDGPTFTPDSKANVLTAFNRKASGSLDQTIDIGAVTPLTYFDYTNHFTDHPRYNALTGFSFTDKSDQVAEALITSDPLLLTIVRSNAAASTNGAWIVISGGTSPQFRITTNIDGTGVVNDWGSTSLIAQTGKYLWLRDTAGANAGDIVTVTLNAGSSTDDWNITTQGAFALPANTVAPVASGTGQYGNTLSVTKGSWTGGGLVYSYQWRRDAVNISLATNSTYVLVITDASTSVDCVVTATNSFGAASQDSNNITVVALSPPVNVSAPIVSGTPSVGLLLVTTPGSWTGRAPITFTYQWQRNDSDITDAVGTSYVITQADVGLSISCFITATNLDGLSTQESNAVLILAGSTETVGSGGVKKNSQTTTNWFFKILYRLFGKRQKSP